jgi:hypothetical protein
VNHYCTYFDRHFLVQGMAMAASLRQHDPDSLLWVLCLDTYTTAFLREIEDERINIIDLGTIELADPELLEAKSSRNSIEYYFTLSPCWPRYLLREYPEIDRITYVDADMFFFASPTPIFSEMREASVLITEHRYPSHLCHLMRCGRFNVGLLSFRNNAIGHACLDTWRENCLAWCHDRVEDGKYADQKYLDEWPLQLGKALHIVRRRGVNLAPWNWSHYQYSFEGGRIWVHCDPLEVFHFARFRPTLGNRCFQSGQLEYGVMPWRLRQNIYGTYWRALNQSLELIKNHRPEFQFSRPSIRRWHNFWRALAPRVLFGSDWLRIGSIFISGRLSFGRYSGLLLSRARLGLSGETIQEAVKPASVLTTELPTGRLN